MTAALVAVDPDGLARRTRLARDIGEALAKLAVHASPTDVALALEAGGWRGVRLVGGACPVARYLADVVPDLAPYTTTVLSGSWFSQGDRIDGLMPEPVAKFISRFDDGLYPGLDAHVDADR